MCSNYGHGRGWVWHDPSGATSNAPFVRKLRPPRTHARRPKPSGAGRGIHSGLATRPTSSRAQAPHSTPTFRQRFYMPAISAFGDPQQTRDAGGARRTTETRDIPLSSAAQLRALPGLPRDQFSGPWLFSTAEARTINSSSSQLRALPRLPHLAFSSSDEKRRKPPARAASRSTKDRESRSALLAPAVDWEGHPAPRSRPERPRSREQEPRLTFNVRQGRCAVCFRGKCGVWRFYHATSA